MSQSSEPMLYSAAQYLFYQRHKVDARCADLSMIGRDQHYHIINLNIFNYHPQIIYRSDGTDGRVVRTQTYKEIKLTGKHLGARRHFCVKPQKILDLWRYGSHRSNSRSTPLFRSLMKHTVRIIVATLLIAIVFSLTALVSPLFKCNTRT